MSRDTPVLLFDGHDGSKSDECGVNIDNVLFDDQATTAVNADYLTPFKDISIRPLDRLDRYNGLQAGEKRKKKEEEEEEEEERLTDFLNSCHSCPLVPTCFAFPNVPPLFHYQRGTGRCTFSTARKIENRGLS